MKAKSSNLKGGEDTHYTVLQLVIFAIPIIINLVQPTYGQTFHLKDDGQVRQRGSQIGLTALVLQQSPSAGGRISPSVGIHYFELNTVVTLSAIANPGYEFVYWLGEVNDPVSSTTTVYLDGPKIIIAVFERSEFELLAERNMGYGAGGGLVRKVAEYTYPSGSIQFPPPEPPRPPSPPQPPEPPKPPIPEPSTGILLVLGSWLMLAQRKIRQ